MLRDGREHLKAGELHQGLGTWVCEIFCVPLQEPCKQTQPVLPFGALVSQEKRRSQQRTQTAEPSHNLP